MIMKSSCSVCYQHVVLALGCLYHFLQHIYTLILFQMSGSPTLPLGISGKDPLLLRSDGAPLSLLRPQPANMATPARADPDLELFKDMVERTECANVRIRKLNLLQSQRRLESQGPADISDDELEESLPTISSFMHPSTQPSTSPPTPGSADAPHDAFLAPGSSSLPVGTSNPALQPHNSSPSQSHPGLSMRSSDWHALMSLDTSPPQDIVKPDYIDFS